jgi:hypothetical protein
MNQFQQGDRVRLSEKGREHLWHRKGIPTGIIKGRARDPDLIRVLVDENKHTESYHYSFWELDTPELEVKYSARREGLVPLTTVRCVLV